MSYQLSQSSAEILKEMVAWYRQNRGRMGNFYRRNPRMQSRPGSGGNANVLRATVVVAPGFQNPIALDGTPDYAGINYYVLRATDVADFVANKSPAYVLNETAVDPADNRVYTMTNSGGISNDGLSPHENSTDWTISDEIKVEYASCLFNRETEEGYSIRDTFPIFQPGDVVRYISFTKSDDSVIYLLDETVSRIGSIEDRGMGMQLDDDGVPYYVPVYV